MNMSALGEFSGPSATVNSNLSEGRKPSFLMHPSFKAELAAAVPGTGQNQGLRCERPSARRTGVLLSGEETWGRGDKWGHSIFRLQAYRRGMA